LEQASFTCSKAWCDSTARNQFWREPVGPFSSTSKATQTTTTVDGQGQLFKNAPVLQGGSKGSAGKQSKYIEAGGSDLTGAKVQSGGVNAAKGSAVQITNNGLTGNDLTALVGTLQTAQPAQIDAVSPIASLSPGFENPPALQPDASATADGSISWYWIAGGAVALIALIFFLKK
jgi:hypothetical protein